ncbi:cytochrome c biogenesis protein ResB [Bacillus fengqiuensis]|nr:cytochrome c biogenesis protein ResB [Bacillus fengqiuensis]
MKFALILVIIIGIVSLLSTILIARSVETNYGKSTKRNMTNLTASYIVVLIGSLIGIVWYAIVAL